MDSDVLIRDLELNTLQLSLVGTLVAFFLYLVGAYVSSPLRQYPGPFLAKFTNLWRLYYVSRGSFHKVLGGLHAKYGPVVRVGPNVLDVDYPELIKTVFNVKGDWKKTEYYLASSAVVEGHIVYNLFSQLDKDKHAAEKKPIAKFYSPNGVAPFESHVDITIKQLCGELEKRFMTGEAAGKPFDLGKWIAYYTWDVIGAMTFSQPLGYLSKGYDFDGTLHNSDKTLDYFSWVGCMPFLDHWLDKNPICRIGPPNMSVITGVNIQHLIDRYQGADASYHSDAQPDYLDRFLEAKKADPSFVTDNQIVSWLMINMVAGADTTAITIRSALYYSLFTPSIWVRLRAELAAAGLTRADCPLSFKQTRSVAYLEAIVREGLRYLPGVSLSLERYVPPGGQKLPGGAGFVPEGAILAFNPYLICRNKEVWGEDANMFRPERWLRAEGEAEEAYAERLKAMNAADLSFGAGSRMCLGKHLALMQVYKVVGTLAVLYDVELARPGLEWKIINSWFPRQEGFEAKMAKKVD